MSVTPIRPGLNATPAAANLTSIMADTVQNFEADGHTPTGAVVIVFDNDGCWRVGWDGRTSGLPTQALIGMALNALVHHRGG